MKPIGYSILTDQDIESTGELYDYTWAGNGIFIEAENPLIKVCIPITEAPTRGLQDLTTPEIILKHGRIEERYFRYIVKEMIQNPEGEEYFAIVWEDEEYKIKKPKQVRSASEVTYEQLSNVVIDIHSHPGGKHIDFSSQDDKDEQGLKIYCVVGALNHKLPVAMARLGVYGYFHNLDWHQVFIPAYFKNDIFCKWQLEAHSQDKILAENMRDFWKHLNED